MNGLNPIASAQIPVGAGFPVNQFDELGKTALHYAAEVENIEIIKILLDAGADVNAQNESVAGNTPLGDCCGFLFP